jgi:hypothetical protein
MVLNSSSTSPGELFLDNLGAGVAILLVYFEYGLFVAEPIIPPSGNLTGLKLSLELLSVAAAVS